MKRVLLALVVFFGFSACSVTNADYRFEPEDDTKRCGIVIDVKSRYDKEHKPIGRYCKDER